LESWNAADHPDQRRLRSYLDEVEALINACVPATSDHLALELIVGLRKTVDLLSGGRDLDNYVFPIARRAGPNADASAGNRRRSVTVRDQAHGHDDHGTRGYTDT
jgi:hypothetical protein